MLTSVRSNEDLPDVLRVDNDDGCVFVTMLVSPCVGRVVVELACLCPTVAIPLMLSEGVYTCRASPLILREGLW